METIKWGAPIRYWGGKDYLKQRILPLIPSHRVYCEPFCGGAAIYWNKKPALIEVLNDLNDNIINFYKVLRLHYEELFKQIDATLHSQYDFNKSIKILKNPDGYTDIERAVAYFVYAQQSWMLLDDVWELRIKESSRQRLGSADLYRNKVLNLRKSLSERLQHTSILNEDALSVIKRCDDIDTFFFIDPPYIDTDQSRSGYIEFNREDLLNLLELLSTIKGMFMLTYFENKGILEYAHKKNWHIKIEEQRYFSKLKNAIKQEYIIMNYELKEHQLNLF